MPDNTVSLKNNAEKCILDVYKRQPQNSPGEECVLRLRKPERVTYVIMFIIDG